MPFFNLELKDHGLILAVGWPGQWKTQFVRDKRESVFEFPRSAKIRFATLDAPGQKRTFALTELAGAELPTPPVPRVAAAVIQIDAFDDCIARLKDEGVKLYPEGVLKGEDGAPKGRELGFVDHDGHLIVIYRLNDA